MTDSTRRQLLKLPLLAAAPYVAPYVARAEKSVDPLAIASLLLVGFVGTTENANGARILAEHLAANRIGGVCFLGHNTKTRKGIMGLTKLFNSANQALRPIIAVDQEGGAVQRLGARNGYHAYPRAQTVARKNTPKQATKLYAEMARELNKAGFNLNLAPVVDLGIEVDNPVVYKWGRTFGDNGQQVAEYAEAFVDAHRQFGVMTALKHFPGHGSTVIDSHAKPVDITSTWQPEELQPFRLLADRDKIDIVMSGHLSHDQLSDGLPATLSSKAVGILRNDLRYNGVIMTDDLDMKAIRSSYSLNDAVVRSIAAGYDLILLSNSLDPDAMLPQRIIAAVQQAVSEGRISADSIHESAERITNLKAATLASAS